MLSRLHQCAYLSHLYIKNQSDSHDPEIERGRYTRPRTDQKQRLCSWCFEIEDEEHFITICQINVLEHQNLYTKFVSKHSTFRNLGNHEQFIFFMSCKDRHLLIWLGKFIHKSFNIRNTKSRVFRHSNIFSSMLLIVTNCTLLVLLRQLTFATELSVTFFRDLVLICRHTLLSVLYLRYLLKKLFYAWFLMALQLWIQTTLSQTATSWGVWNPNAI